MALIGKTVYNKTGKTVLFEGSYNPKSAIAQDLLDDLISYGVTEISETIGGPSIDHEAGIDAFDDIVYDVTPEPTPVYPETIAGQISRLQDAKACIKASIESKGVSIGSNVKLDNYSSCIDSIPTGSQERIIDTIVVGGGAGGSSCGGGGGAGEVVPIKIRISDCPLCICIGAGGAVNCDGGKTTITQIDGNVLIMKANGGLAPQKTDTYYCVNGGASGNGYKGGAGYYVGYQSYICGTGGGGGAGGDGYPGKGTNSPGYGGPSLCGYGCGGNGSTRYGGNTVCGGGGPGCNGGAGNGGIVKICYKTDGSCGINYATGGTITTEGNYKVHTFTSDGTFCITG